MPDTLFAERRTESGMRLRLLCMCQGWCMVQHVAGGQPYTVTLKEWLAMPTGPNMPKRKETT